MTPEEYMAKQGEAAGKFARTGGVPLPSTEPTMAGTLTIRTTQNHGKVTDLRYSTIWSAWLDGEMVGKGYCYKPEQAEQQALDLVTPEQVTNIKIVTR